MIATPTRVSTTAISADRTAVKSSWPIANTDNPPMTSRQPPISRHHDPVLGPTIPAAVRRQRARRASSASRQMKAAPMAARPSGPSTQVSTWPNPSAVATISRATPTAATP